MEFAVADPRSPEVSALLEQHRRFAHDHTPPDDVHALDVGGLLDPAVTLFSLMAQGAVLAIGALKDLGGGHVEIKSMHTAAAARGRGNGRAMLHHLLSEAAARGATRVSLETGPGEAFAAARGLSPRPGSRSANPSGTTPVIAGIPS